jgi:hypothetical protein
LESNRCKSGTRFEAASRHRKPQGHKSHAELQREVSVARVSGALMVCFADLVMNENIAKLHLILGIKQQTLKGEDEGWLVPVSSK